jgi:phosphoglycerate dehydrogenase-like enzyme
MGSEILAESGLTDFVKIADGDRDRLRRSLEHADALVADELDPSDTVGASHLRLVQLLSAGYDGFDLEALPPGCTFCNVHLHETAISEWVLMAMLALTRRLLIYDHDLREGEWNWPAWSSGVPDRDLSGKTLGIIGLGNIGSCVAEKARALGMVTVAVTRSPSHEQAARLGLSWQGDMERLPDLLGESDFVLLALPLSEDTRDLIGERELRLLGPTGYLLNVSRGLTVNEAALFEALTAGTIAGAAIDVWYQYPSQVGERTLPASLPFWQLDNVIMTPHSAGWSESTMRQRWLFVADQLKRLSRREPLENVVHIAPSVLGTTGAQKS